MTTGVILQQSGFAFVLEQAAPCSHDNAATGLAAQSAVMRDFAP
jgi:hypothetical protein